MSLGTAPTSTTVPIGASASSAPSTTKTPVAPALERSRPLADRRPAISAGRHNADRDSSRPNRWGVVVVAGLSIYMAQLDTTIVNVALPAIEADLVIATSVTQWVVLAYLVPLIGLSLLTGRWLDAIGHRSALTIAVVGFAAASVAAGASPSAAALIAARAAQGGFAALLLSLAPVLAVNAVDSAARGRALGVVGTLAPLGAMTGPIVGGQLVDALGWPWIFYTNVPVALVVLALGRARLPAGAGLRLPQRSWLVEAVILGTAAVAVLLAATFVVSDGWLWAGLALAAPPLVAIWRRMGTSRPIRTLISAPNMTAVHISLVSSYTVLLLVQFLTPFFLTRSLGASATLTGLTLLALPVTTAVLGLLSGALADRFGNHHIALIGATGIAIGVGLLLPLASTWTPFSLAWRLAILGVGFGLFMTPTTSLAMGIAPRSLLGVTSASTNLARYLGLALGPAIATAAWAATGYRIEGMRIAVAIASVTSLITIVTVARTRPRDSASRQHTGHRAQPRPPTARVSHPRDPSASRGRVHRHGSTSPDSAHAPR